MRRAPERLPSRLASIDIHNFQQFRVLRHQVNSLRIAAHDRVMQTRLSIAISGDDICSLPDQVRNHVLMAELTGKQKCCV